jgi:hypothetical protein
MTACETAKGQPRAFEDAKPDEGDVGILRTSGEIKTMAWAEGVEDGRQYGLVKAVDDADGEAGLGIGHSVRT